MSKCRAFGMSGDFKYRPEAAFGFVFENLVEMRSLVQRTSMSNQVRRIDVASRKVLEQPRRVFLAVHLSGMKR